MCVCLQEQNIYTFTTVQIQMHIGRRKRREMEMIPKGHTNRLVVLLIAVTVGWQLWSWLVTSGEAAPENQWCAPSMVSMVQQWCVDLQGCCACCNQLRSHRRWKKVSHLKSVSLRQTCPRLEDIWDHLKVHHQWDLHEPTNPNSKPRPDQNFVLNKLQNSTVTWPGSKPTANG